MLLYFDMERKEEIAQTITKNQTAILTGVLGQTNFPEAIVLASQTIKAIAIRAVAKNCLFCATGETPQGRKNIGVKKTKRYKTHLTILPQAWPSFFCSAVSSNATFGVIFPASASPETKPSSIPAFFSSLGDFSNFIFIPNMALIFCASCY